MKEKYDIQKLIQKNIEKSIEISSLKKELKEKEKIINRLTQMNSDKAKSIKRYEVAMTNDVYSCDNIQKIAVCAIAKMENHYIREWVEHYQSIGVDKIILYDNNDVYGEHFEEVIQDYIDNGFVIIEDVRGKTKYQRTAYNLCMQKYREQFNWIGYFDCDEFLMIEDNSDIHDVLSNQRYADFDSINIAWKNYTDNDLIRVENNDYSLIKRFTSFIFNDTQIKSFIRTTIPYEINDQHVGNVEIKCCNTIGEPSLKNKKSPHIKNSTWKVMCLNHYKTKTLEEYIKIRLRRGGVNDNLNRQTFDYFFQTNKRTPQKLNYIKQFITSDKQLLKRAKYIQFANKGKYLNIVKDCHNLPNGQKYIGDKNNSHHFTTKFHRMYVLPLLERMFNFGYTRDDFDIVENVVGEHDFSYLKPKQEIRYNVTCFTNGETKSNVSYDELMTTENKTPYHNLYVYSHKCSMIENLTTDSNRVLFISGDSQMIPSILPLSVYFKKIYYFDNRSGKYKLNGVECYNYDLTRTLSKYYLSNHITDVLVALFKDIERYTKINLK